MTADYIYARKTVPNTKITNFQLQGKDYYSIMGRGGQLMRSGDVIDFGVGWPGVKQAVYLFSIVGKKAQHYSYFLETGIILICIRLMWLFFNLF